ncbi:PREDICTED: protein trichome birefringence-like 34 [Erythranthe guttata]|uniref:protein trichome birefringence-like 34 n=1 Tax=Erythranthe guttata TaxID=4155 RepID=UPI00064D9D7C|nr:PREDICTED: protein trichome birefringence-like 34 [Erythranthe guttata]|eukprot:XP_012831784.1 PREDICTED: protein trichome birefringence-like 34 [Erythranthe guttata]
MKEYNATIEFYWSPLLVESNCDNPDSHHVKDRVLRIKSIEKHARHWTDADILIFNSFMWWHNPTMTIFGESLNDGNCYNVTEPIMKEDYWGIATDVDMMHIAESTIRKLEERGLRVEYLNITHLSDYRKDAHSSIYRQFFHLSDDQLSNPKSYSDCVHWCLPGVPDVWNQIFYSYIINSL